MSSISIYITEKMRFNFKPTYLMIKQHEITGLKYLCKTIKKDPIKYNGSGKYWKNHIKKYGKTHVKTIWCKLFTNIDELVSTATTLSEMYDVVNSQVWANLKIETGLDGFSLKTENPFSKRKDGSSVGRDNAKRQVLEGTHPFLGGDIVKQTNKRRMENGTHNFQNSEFQRKVTKTRIENGTHNFQSDSHKTDVINRNHINSSRIEYLELKELYTTLGIKKPPFLHMKSLEALSILKMQLLELSPTLEQ